ncbi:MAG: hypothetical protein Q9217_003682 [Psora testacea]
MGYYNPLLSYGEEQILKDAKEAGVNGFIVVDLSPEEAVRFRNFCKRAGRFIVLAAKNVWCIADSFIYVVSRMGLTGTTGKLASGLPELLDRVHTYSNNVPAAVGFGVSTREHFVEVGKVAEGVVIGSQIVTVLADAPAGEVAKNVEEYCSESTGSKGEGKEFSNGVLKHEKKKMPKSNGYHLENGHGETEEPVHADEVIKLGQNGSGPELATQLEALNVNGGNIDAVPSRFWGIWRTTGVECLRIKLLGAKVVAVETGAMALRDAVNEALRAWVVELPTMHYIIGSAIGPHPVPTIVRTFQSVIGNETKDQMQRLKGKLPDAVVACVGGVSNAVGMYYPFAQDPSVKMLGVEAGGDGLDTDRHSATLTGGSKGPELSSWKDNERAKFIAATDAEAFEGFRLLSQLEGIIPALEIAHAIWSAVKLAKEMSKGKDIVVSLSGRGDKDVQSVADELPKIGPKIG